MTSQIKNKWYYILNVYRLIRSEVRETLRTIHELIKLTMLSYKYLLQVVLLLKSYVCFATLHNKLFSHISLYLWLLYLNNKLWVVDMQCKEVFLSFMTTKSFFPSILRNRQNFGNFMKKNTFIAVHIYMKVW